MQKYAYSQYCGKSCPSPLLDDDLHHLERDEKHQMDRVGNPASAGRRFAIKENLPGDRNARWASVATAGYDDGDSQ